MIYEKPIIIVFMVVIISVLVGTCVHFKVPYGDQGTNYSWESVLFSMGSKDPSQEARVV